MTVLNTMMGAQLMKFKAEVEKLTVKGRSQDEAILQVLKALIKKSRAIRFEGDGYSDEWREEATFARGLNNITTTPPALDALVSDSTKKLFTSTGVLSERELSAFHEVQLESYTLKLDIESKMMEEMCLSYVLPAAIGYQTKLAENVNGLEKIGFKAEKLKYQTAVIEQIADATNDIYELINKMSKKRDKAHHAGDARAMAVSFCDDVKPIMDKIRENADALEHIMDDKAWPLAKYREMLFVR
jgi:glutamine synthetase